MKTQFTRFSAFILSIILIITITSFSVYAETPDLETLTDFASTLIYKNEGSYTSVNPNDCGALSIGKVQWHASRALGLLKNIIALNSTNAKNILGTTLYNEITTTSSNWSNRTLTSAEAKAISTLLGTTQGKQAQDSLAYTDISGYIKHGEKLGITDGKALVYFADIENQGGYGTAGSIAKKAAATAGSYAKITLDILHSTALNNMGGYTRRMNTFNYCDSLVFNEHSSSGIYNVAVTNITSAGCNISFKTASVITSVIVYVWDTSETYSASYTLTPSNSLCSVDFTLAKTGYTGTVTSLTFKGKIMAFKKGQTEPYAIYENLNFTVEPAYKITGDVNGDGAVNVKDARLLLRYSAKLESLCAQALTVADITGDGKVNAKDARYTLRVSAKLQ